MNAWQQKVKDFQAAMGVEQRETFRMYSRETTVLRCRLLLEETVEFIKASGCRIGHVERDGKTLMAVAEDPNEVPDILEMIDGLVDTIYIALGSALCLGIDLEPFFQEVHESNMRKLGPDGKPVRRPDGKIVKPEGWKPPDIARVFNEARMGLKFCMACVAFCKPTKVQEIVFKGTLVQPAAEVCPTCDGSV